MNYQELLKRIAEVEDASCENVDAEIKKAIKATGIDIEPMEFITLVLAQTIMENEKNKMLQC